MSAIVMSYALLASSDGGEGNGNGGVRGTVEQIASNHDQIILALIAIIGTAIAALVFTIRNNSVGKEGLKEARAANQAVNNVGPGEHRLYDMISMILEDVKFLTESQREFANKGWATLPADLGDSSALTDTIRRLQAQDAQMIEKLIGIDENVNKIIHDLKEHTDWEMNAKYGLHGDEK